MDSFEHNGQIILFCIHYNWSNKRGQNKSLYLLDIEKRKELRIPFVGFDKDFKTDESILKLIEEKIETIEKWMTT